MTILAQFDTPAGLRETSSADRQAWSARVSAIFGGFVGQFPQLYDPTVTDTPADVRREEVVWTAFPARLLRGATSEEGRWQQADNRAEQDEYCEWSVERDAAGKVTCVTFTSEVPEYFDYLADRDPDRLLAFYREFVNPQVSLDDLVVDGSYRPDNRWNVSAQGPIAHLMQTNNTLGAAVDLVAHATILREMDGTLITEKQALAHCAGLGNPFRNSDPQIAAAVNSAARSRDEVSLADPIGLYINGINTTGMTTPDDADPRSFWTVERGTPEHTLRVCYKVPPERGYAVGDILSNGRPILFGAQLADRVSVRITALVKTAHRTPRPQPCNG